MTENGCLTIKDFEDVLNTMRTCRRVPPVEYTWGRIPTVEGELLGTPDAPYVAKLVRGALCWERADNDDIEAYAQSLERKIE